MACLVAAHRRASRTASSYCSRVSRASSASTSAKATAFENAGASPVATRTTALVGASTRCAGATTIDGITSAPTQRPSRSTSRKSWSSFSGLTR